MVVTGYGLQYYKSDGSLLSIMSPPPRASYNMPRRYNGKMLSSKKLGISYKMVNNSCTIRVDSLLQITPISRDVDDRGPAV